MERVCVLKHSNKPRAYMQLWSGSTCAESCAVSSMLACQGSLSDLKQVVRSGWIAAEPLVNQCSSCGILLSALSHVKCESSDCVTSRGPLVNKEL